MTTRACAVGSVSRTGAVRRQPQAAVSTIKVSVSHRRPNIRRLLWSATGKARVRNRTPCRSARTGPWGEWHFPCVLPGQEERVSKRSFGILASVVGSAVGAWLWNRQRLARRTVQRADPGPRTRHGHLPQHSAPGGRRHHLRCGVWFQAEVGSAVGGSAVTVGGRWSGLLATRWPQLDHCRHADHGV